MGSHNAIINIRNGIMDIHNCIMNIHEYHASWISMNGDWIRDSHNWVMDINDSLMDVNIELWMSIIVQLYMSWYIASGRATAGTTRAVPDCSTNHSSKKLVGRP